MKILGIGNAIVDVICKVDDSFITQNNLTKSTMKLFFDESEFKNLLTNLTIEKTVSGGSVANSIVGLSQLGDKVGFIGKVSEDQFGSKYEEGLKKETQDSNIMFYDEHFQNEIIPGLFTSRTARAGGVLKEMNFFNASSIDIKIEEDDILVFPSKSLHGTQPNKLNSGRISISGDIVCVAKDSELLENMMPPINNWDKL